MDALNATMELVVCVALPKLAVPVVAFTYNTLAVSPLTAKSTVSNAVLKFTRPFVSVMSSPLITILPP